MLLCWMISWTLCLTICWSVILKGNISTFENIQKLETILSQGFGLLQQRKVHLKLQWTQLLKIMSSRELHLYFSIDLPLSLPVGWQCCVYSSCKEILVSSSTALAGLQPNIQMSFVHALWIFHRKVGKYWDTLPREVVEPSPL